MVGKKITCSFFRHEGQSADKRIVWRKWYALKVAEKGGLSSVVPIKEDSDNPQRYE